MDSTFLLAVCDRDDPMHEQARQALQGCMGAGQEMLVPATALAEALSAALCASPPAVRAVRALVDRLATVRVVDEAVAKNAARWHASTAGLSLPAALLVATANATRAASILTFDPSLTHVNHRRIPASTTRGWSS